MASAELLPTQVRWPDIRTSQSALETRVRERPHSFKLGRIFQTRRLHLKDPVKWILSTSAVTMEAGGAPVPVWWAPVCLDTWCPGLRCPGT